MNQRVLAVISLLVLVVLVAGGILYVNCMPRN